MSLTRYIHCSFLLHGSAARGHHQATLVTWGDHCTVHFVLSILRHVVDVVVVVNLFRRIFSLIVLAVI
jgi:hypothetical protein